MTTIYLIRHGETDTLGKTVSGWTPGVHLNRTGVIQAALLAERLACAGIVAVYSSPLERALETAQPLAGKLGCQIAQRQGMGEIHFGDWTARSFKELDRDPLWRRYNTFRSSTQPPRGELMLEVQMRIVAELNELRLRHAEESVAAVSHADVIRAAVAYYAGIPLDLLQRFEISPASVTILRLSEETALLVRLNEECGASSPACKPTF